MVTIRAFNGKITKSASLSASLRVKDYKLLDLTKTAATISLWISQTINGKESGDYVEDVDVPVGTAVTEWYEKGEEAGKKEWRPDYITQSGNKVTVYNAAGDTLGTYSLTDYPSLQTNRIHTTTVSSTTTLTITPSSGYDAMKKATITINVSSSGGGTGGCFAAGSPVRLADGTEVAIEDLKVGMMLAAYDEETQEIVETEVESVQQYKHKDQIYDIRFASGTRLTLTHSHPLLTTHGWCAIDPEAALKEHTYMQEIGRLVIGDTVITRTGTAVVEDVFRREDLMDETVYNIDAEPYDNFFVSDILAHNAKSET